MWRFRRSQTTNYPGSWLRAAKDRGLGRPDALKGMLNYSPITTPVML